MPHVFVENVQEFTARHGGKQVRRKNAENEWLFPDGARYCQSLARSDRPVLHEPPENEQSCLALQLEYAQAKVTSAERDFALLKGALTGMTADGVPGRFSWEPEEYGPAPEETDEQGMPCGIAALTRLRAIVFERRKLAAAIHGAMEALPEVRRQRKMEQWERERKEEQRAFEENLRRRALAIDIDGEAPVVEDALTNLNWKDG